VRQEATKWYTAEGKNHWHSRVDLGHTIIGLAGDYRTGSDPIFGSWFLASFPEAGESKRTISRFF
jgi:hypothetical protein